jgi:hypothetical protein
MSRAASRLPSRREVLVGGGLLALAGCLPGDDDVATPPVDPELKVRARIAAEVRALAGRYQAVMTAHPATRPRLAPLAAEHEAHATALLGPPPSASGSPSPSPSASPSATPPTVPETVDAAVAELVVAERVASRRRARQAGRATPELARLLASVAGSEAAHAALLAAGGPA